MREERGERRKIKIQMAPHESDTNRVLGNFFLKKATQLVLISCTSTAQQTRVLPASAGRIRVAVGRRLSLPASARRIRVAVSRRLS